jgi:hypothetical protein
MLREKCSRGQPPGKDKNQKGVALKSSCEDAVPAPVAKGKKTNHHFVGSTRHQNHNVSSIKLRLRYRRQGRLKPGSARLGKQESSAPAPLVLDTSLKELQKLVINHQMSMKPIQVAIDPERTSETNKAVDKPNWSPYPGAHLFPHISPKKSKLHMYVESICWPPLVWLHKFPS